MWAGDHHQAHATHRPKDVQRPGCQRALQRSQMPTENWTSRRRQVSQL